MKKILLIGLIAIAFLAGSCSIGQLINLANCQFNVQDVTDITWAGINLSKILSPEELTFSNAANAAKAIVNKDFNIQCKVNINAKNDTKKVAKLIGYDYVLYLDGNEIASGNDSNGSYVIPPNGGTTLIPIPVKINLAKILQKESVESIINFAKNLTDYGNGTKSKVTVKFRPYMSAGSSTKKLPAIKLSKKFQ
ncbi:MAG: hypothetical protein RR034_02260 [Bacteroidales bacterium]